MHDQQETVKTEIATTATEIKSSKITEHLTTENNTCSLVSEVRKIKI